ncbi:hypothetical protein OEZ85_011349 [Tetradesmus obliquus]|uniref:RRM domain-containing protein n=1 Tax=Tetradesmus obliquus TaxID=3088 RepID=A0ABY8TSB5_TETOB|nr:hypothetical protein OEZ85_011349 [Tetradesmus obliquus]
MAGNSNSCIEASRLFKGSLAPFWMCKPPASCSVATGSMTGASSGPTFGRRLVFFGAAEAVGEPTLLQLFSQYGDVTGLFLVRSALGLPSGCGYVTMANAEQAAAALAALQGSSECAEAGGKLGLLIVQGPHTEQAEQPQSPQQKQQSGAHTDDNRTAFFTKVPPTVTAHQLIQLFTACGDVVHVELFTPWPGAKISKGCGLVEFAAPEAAAAAVASLHQAFTWPHSHSPLVVEWLDAKRQAANRASKLVKHGSGDSTTNMRRAAAAAAADQEPRMAAAVGYGSHSGHITGVAGQVSSAHSVAAMMLSNMGISDPLLPAGMH